MNEAREIIKENEQTRWLVQKQNKQGKRIVVGTYFEEENAQMHKKALGDKVKCNVVQVTRSFPTYKKAKGA